MYYVIYDGNCNLCVTLVQTLESLDRGETFLYIPMQNEPQLRQLNVTPEDCDRGMILIDADDLSRRWQGSDAAAEIGHIVPAGRVFVDLYRSLPGLKWIGDRAYEQVRDNRYRWFGQRNSTYSSSFPVCEDDSCASLTK